MLIRSRRVWTGEGFEPGRLEITDGKIKAVRPWTGECDRDYGDMRILPGFLDAHTHGAYGFDTNDADAEGLRRWVSRIPQEGVTAILPTTVTQSREVLLDAVRNVADVAERGCRGAEILGIHFEGPYLDMRYKGAQPPEAIAVPSVEEFSAYQEAARGWIKYITMASEHDGAAGGGDYHALLRYCVDHGVKVSLGHSSADYDEVLRAVDDGAVSVTHTFNGMAPLHHRNPGLLGAALADERLYGEIICDGLHSHPAAVRLFFRCKGADKGVMVTDSLRAKYGKAGAHYQLGGHDIAIDERGLARLGDGTIAGSTLRMNEGLRIAIEEAGVPEKSAINACTRNPARMIGVENRKGSLAAGFDADIVVLDDGYRVVDTYCRGSKVDCTN